MKKLFSHLRNPKVLQPLLLGLIMLFTLLGFLFYQVRRARVFIDTSVIEAPIITIAPQTPGKLLEMDVYENETIKKGDLLAIVSGQSLYADTDGLIITTNDQIGSLTSTQNPTVQMINTKDLRVAGTIDENKGLSDVKVGQPASFTVDALSGKTFWGYVDEVSPSSKQTQLSFSISSERPTQQFVVYVRYNGEKYPEIKNGMSAKLTIFTQAN
jgi:multidrug resistance efflux pump